MHFFRNLGGLVWRGGLCGHAFLNEYNVLCKFPFFQVLLQGNFEHKHNCDSIYLINSTRWCVLPCCHLEFIFSIWFLSISFTISGDFYIRKINFMLFRLLIFITSFITKFYWRTIRLFVRKVGPNSMLNLIL